ncbi:hypothetical protein CHARACLAT_024848 [Characodon lateralis]|uniref:Uncharacterized protein n=1 Tax=Characodon lateralis TaxID=208331 RepID=A0ABU7ECY3_9TELE|nr:hypothetical protein [Characodon lateralis]
MLFALYASVPLAECHYGSLGACDGAKRETQILLVELFTMIVSPFLVCALPAASTLRASTSPQAFTGSVMFPSLIFRAKTVQGRRQSHHLQTFSRGPCRGLTMIIILSCAVIISVFNTRVNISSKFSDLNSRHP